MAVTLDKKKQTVHIEGLEISSPEVYNFLVDQKKPEAWVEKALIIGCVGLKQMVIKENVDLVEKEFQKLLAEFKDVTKKQSEEVSKKIDDTFDPEKKSSVVALIQSIVDEYFDEKDGTFKKTLDKYLDKDGGELRKLIDSTFDVDSKKSAVSKLITELEEKTDLGKEEIKKLLNPNKEDSPIGILRSAVLEKIEVLKEDHLKVQAKDIKEILTTVTVAKKVEEEKEKGTQKGFDFEDKVHDALEELSRPHSDSVEHVGKKGKGSKKGDINVDFNDNENTRLAVECKDRDYSSKLKGTKEEILAAIKNRKAAFGLMIFNKPEQMPSKWYPMKITENYIVTYFEPDKLEVAYRLARTLLLKDTSAPQAEVDLAKISQELEKIEIIMGNIETMKGKATSVVNAGKYLKDHLDKLATVVDASIVRIRTQMGETIGSFDNHTEGSASIAESAALELDEEE